MLHVSGMWRNLHGTAQQTPGSLSHTDIYRSINTWMFVIYRFTRGEKIERISLLHLWTQVTAGITFRFFNVKVVTTSCPKTNDPNCRRQPQSSLCTPSGQVSCSSISFLWEHNLREVYSLNITCFVKDPPEGKKNIFT